ncbi:MAG: hypothetical protein AAF205_04545 [Pseudomonadota bacterium]
MPFFDRLRSLDGLLLIALVGAVLMRGLIPAGWMAGNVDGVMRLTICSGAGEADIWIDEAGNRIAEPGLADTPTGNGMCDFAPLWAAYDLPDRIAVPALRPVIETAMAHVPQLVAIGRGLAAPPPYKTGPPPAH